MMQGGSRGPPRASEAGGGGLPPAMLAGHKVVRFSDFRLQLVLGTVLFSPRELQSAHARDFVFSAISELLYR